MDENTLVLLVSIDAPRWVPFADGGPVLAPGAWRRVVAEMQRELRRCDDASLLALEGLALLLASKVTRGTALERDARQPAWLSDALECIDRSFADAITVASIAERVGVHRATLAAAFRRYRGVSAGELIRERRVHHAMVLLAGTRIPLDELAQQAGFCDQSHMSRLFRRAIGMTPGKYRAVSS